MCHRDHLFSVVKGSGKGSSGAHLIQRHLMDLQGCRSHCFEVNLLVVFHHRMENSRRAHIAIVGWACTILCLVSYVAAFSHGASLSACTDMMPRHLRAQLHSPNNYVTVHTNMSFYSPGDKVPGKEQLLIPASAKYMMINVK